MNSNTVFDSGVFAFNTASNPLLLSNIGKFSYSQSDVNNDYPGIVMDGIITVGEDNSSGKGYFNINSNAIETKVDTVNH